MREQLLSEGRVEILYRKTKKKDFRDNTLAQEKNFQSAVLQEGVSTDIYTVDETVYCTFNNP